MRRRGLLFGGAALALGAAGGLGACGAGGGGAGGGKVELRVAWWGNAVRNDLTNQVIKLYESKHPEVTIVPEPGDFGTYWEKLSTQVAARDAPDVIQMDAQKIREYGGRGALLDLNTTALDVSDFLESSQGVGVIGNERFAVNGAVTERIYLANPDVFKAAKVELPDDTTWTWDEFAELSGAITRATPDGTWGAVHPVLSPHDALMWLRQGGKDLFTEEGIGFEPADLAGFFELGKRMTDDKAVPEATIAVEELSKNSNQSMFWTGHAALSAASSNQVVAISEATGADLEILRYPSMTGKAVDAKAFVTGLSWSVAGSSKLQDEAVAFLNFILNDVEAGKILGDERGLPPNNTVRAEVVKSQTGAEAKAAKFVEETEAEISEPPVTPLLGGAGWSTVLARHAQDMLFGRATPVQAAEAVHKELDGLIEK